jgi:plastocyanin
MKKAIYIIAGVFLALVVGVILFMRKPQTGSQVTTSPSPTPVATNEGQPSEVGVREIEVIGTEYAFSPVTLSLTKGQKVKLTFKNMGRMPHNFVIEELGINTKTIQGGQSDTVEFTPSEVGIFAFYCSISNHRQMGMEGSLEVK